MKYEGQICRAPMERSSFMLPVMVGCSYNRCKFCNLFRHLKYRELPMEQIEDELKRVQALGGNPKKIFLGDGNAFVLKMEKLVKILDLIHIYFPECQCINMDATVTSVLKKTDEELQLLHEKGVRHLYLGIESGLDDVLKFMEKDHDLEQAYEAIGRLQKAGLIYDAHIMTGVAGAGRGEENALALADFLNKTKPIHVVNFSMFLHKEVPLYANVVEGSFVPADELANLKEERVLIEHLMTDEKDDAEEMVYDGFHDFIEIRIKGKLPKDKEKMLAKLDRIIAEYQEREPIYSYVYGECPNLERCDKNEKVWQM
ncbi:MAG: radical SAM protein [Dorea sp.]